MRPLVRLDGYTEDEKVAIARNHLVPRQIDLAGLAREEVAIDEEALRVIATEYTHEAGVRQLERAIAKVLRKVTTRLAGESENTPVEVGTKDLNKYLGRPRFTPESAERTAVPGVATGLAVTGAGGDVLFIEATVMEGEPRLVLTGQLGDVMKESAQIALSYLRSHSDAVGIDTERLGQRRDPLARPGGRSAQGRALRRRHDGRRPGLSRFRTTGALRGGHDRGSHLERSGAPDRRREAEAAGGSPSRPDRDLPPGPQRA